MVRQGLLPGPRRAQERLAGRHQEGVPQARAAVPPGREPRQQGRRGAVQGDLRGQRRPVRPGEAGELRPGAGDGRGRVRPGRTGSRRRGAGRAAFGGPGGVRYETADFDIGDLLRGFGNAGGRGRQRQQRPQRGADLETTVEVSFEDAMSGTTVPVRITGPAVCHTCHGSGAEPGTDPITCPTCGGAGSVSVNQGFFSMEQPCPRVPGQRAHHRAPVPDVPRLGSGAADAEVPGQDPGGREGRRADQAGRSRRARAGGRAARRPLRAGARPRARRVRPQGRQPDASICRSPIRRRRWARTSRCPR